MELTVLEVPGCPNAPAFAEPGAPTALACRLYRDEDGTAGGAPSVTALRRVLEQAGARG
jgi:hypothetical protein